MRSLSCLAVLAISFSGAILAQVPPSPTEQPDGDAKQEFQDLINALPEESLQAALHGHIPQFKDGVFESSRHGLERVHEKNPRLASKLIVAAVQDLQRRQTPPDGNSTATAASDTATPSQTPTSLPSSDGSTSSVSPSPSQPESSSASATPSATPTSNPPAETSETPSNSPTPIPTPTTTLTPTASAVIPVTTTNSRGSTVTSKETIPAVVITTTNSAGRTSRITSAVVSEPMAIPTTNERGSTFYTTITPTVQLVSSLVLVTSKGSNGELITKTSVTYINPAQATGQDGAPPSETSVTPGLQSGVAGPAKAVGAAGLWGVAGVVAMMI